MPTMTEPLPRPLRSTSRCPPARPSPTAPVRAPSKTAPEPRTSVAERRADGVQTSPFATRKTLTVTMVARRPRFGPESEHAAALLLAGFAPDLQVCRTEWGGGVARCGHRAAGDRAGCS